MFVSDFAVMLLLPWAWRELRHSAISPQVRALLVTGSLWLLSLIVTDIVRRTPPTDFLRGWGEIALSLGALIVFYAAVSTRPERTFTLLWGLALAMIIRTWAAPIDAAAEVPWRLGGLSSLVLIVLLTLVLLPRAVQSAVIYPSLIGLSGFAFVIESRSLGGVLFASTLFLLWTGWISRRGYRLPKRRHLAGALILALMGLVAVLQAYSTLAEAGVLGESARQKYLAQEASALGLFLTGRSDNVGSIIAIADSPILGHGSRAEDEGYRAQAEHWLRKNGYTVQLPDHDGIPLHSYLLGSWVQAGLGGPVFWLTVVFTVMASLLAAPAHSPAAIRALLAFMVINLLWAIAFSPFGGLGRIIVPASLAAILLLPTLARVHANATARRLSQRRSVVRAP